jgi:hypothetical protein
MSKLMGRSTSGRASTYEAVSKYNEIDKKNRRLFRIYLPISRPCSGKAMSAFPKKKTGSGP